jgi:hypothetical protein
MDIIQIKLPPGTLERLQDATAAAAEVTGYQGYPIDAVALNALLKGLVEVERQVAREATKGPVLRIVK